MDLSDEGNEYRLLVEVPGAQKEGLEVTAGPVPGTLYVKVEGRETHSPQTPLRAERGTRGGKVRFERIVPVAWNADVSRAKPTLENGILTVTVPKQGAGGEKETGEKKK